MEPGHLSNPGPVGELAPTDILRLEDGAVVLLDQTLLPSELAWNRYEHWPQVVEAIRSMVVRGAPAIGIAGAMGVALAAMGTADDASQQAQITAAAAELRAARPTAVNLAWAVDRQLALAQSHPGPPAARAKALADAARQLHLDEVARCRAIGAHALPLLTRGARILTHCNAGGLATGGYGSALGIVRAAHTADPTVRVVVDETRPLLQGSRLTAWELARDGIPFTLIADSMAAALMAEGRVSHVVVGADRIAANGDVVNKIGTYGVAILAREHGIPVIVAAPTSTIDLACRSGAEVPVEERAADEVRGLVLDGRPAADPTVAVANPAFDRTPSRLVTAIVTEMGIHRPPYERSLAEAVARALVDPCVQVADLKPGDSI